MTSYHSNCCTPCNPKNLVLDKCGLYGNGTGGAITIDNTVNWCTDPLFDNNSMLRSLTINFGATLIVPSGTKIRTTGNFTNNGTLIVQSIAPGESSINNISDGTPLIQANSKRIPVLDTVGNNSYGGLAYNSGVLAGLVDPGLQGGGNGGLGSTFTTPENTILAQGGFGGGALSIYSMGSIINNGDINADGGNGSVNGSEGNGPGGGAGGIIILVSKCSIINQGNIHVNGGNGAQGSSTGNYSSGGGGSGGLIRLIAPNATSVGGNLGISGGSTPVSIGTNALGGGGGAMGGNGGNGESSNSVGTNGNDGIIIRTNNSCPENIF